LVLVLVLVLVRAQRSAATRGRTETVPCARAAAAALPAVRTAVVCAAGDPAVLFPGVVLRVRPVRLRPTEEGKACFDRRVRAGSAAVSSVSAGQHPILFLCPPPPPLPVLFTLQPD